MSLISCTILLYFNWIIDNLVKEMVKIDYIDGVDI